jgi:hypothetical protein
MGNGIPPLLRRLAVLGMALAFLNFVSAFAGWAAYQNGAWVGKRIKDAVEPPAAPTVRPAVGPTSSGAVTAPGLLRFVHAEAAALFQAVREPSQWFCLTGIVYLLTARRPGRDPDEDGG